jgi:hypothetical protein
MDQKERESRETLHFWLEHHQVVPVKEKWKEKKQQTRGKR